MASMAPYTHAHRLDTWTAQARYKEPEKFMNVVHMSNSYIKAVYFPHLDCRLRSPTARNVATVWVASGAGYRRTDLHQQIGLFIPVLKPLHTSHRILDESHSGQRSNLIVYMKCSCGSRYKAACNNTPKCLWNFRCGKPVVRKGCKNPRRKGKKIREPSSTETFGRHFLNCRHESSR